MFRCCKVEECKTDAVSSIEVRMTLVISQKAISHHRLAASGICFSRTVEFRRWTLWQNVDVDFCLGEVYNMNRTSEPGSACLGWTSGRPAILLGTLPDAHN